MSILVTVGKTACVGSSGAAGGLAANNCYNTIKVELNYAKRNITDSPRLEGFGR
ncbi:MAG: hypothetical protein II685_04860 [Clostridia bacterium]|nr:hypothetical protein [Clostridia bacterium]